ncbi:MAG: hypothetical protein GF383_04610 [Candidatus Lokiarchaeota archaeon]|nr:hypothetical protein [Candidatus Lokiarchaeota archaeon]MBD3339067.1 hypothetical protein [Candidatus Lokiarchaeota archaeon]
MKNIDIDQVYEIDVERMLGYYDRIKAQFTESDSIEIIARFLNKQSIGSSVYDVIDFISYYTERLAKNKKQLDFAFEWIRAQKIRLEYKKFLGSAQFSNLKLAIDTCIYLFFQKYDQYLRELFKKDIKEYEISTIYEIFFTPLEIDKLSLNAILEKHKNIVPTFFKESSRIDTHIITLRRGLKEIIKHDFQ